MTDQIQPNVRQVPAASARNAPATTRPQVSVTTTIRAPFLPAGAKDLHRACHSLQPQPDKT